MKTLGTLLLVLSFSAHAATSIDERAPAEAQGDVQISNIAGEVNVVGWNKKEIEVTGELGDGAKELIFERDGARTLIKVVYEKGVRRKQHTKLNISIPQLSELAVSVVSADINVKGVKGEQRLQGVSSDITVETFEQALEVEVISGDIDVTGHDDASHLLLTTVSGDIHARSLAGDVEFNSVSGDLVVDGDELNQVSAKTTSGDIIIRADLAKGGRWKGHTINGDVTLGIASGNNLDVDVQTHSGDIEACFGESSERRSKYGPGRYLRFSNGKGDRKVSVDTLNGDVDICS